MWRCLTIILSLDFETTGLDFQKDRIIEIGAVLYSTNQKKCLESLGCLVQTDIPITEEITGITSIHPAAVKRFGYDQEMAFNSLQRMIEDADALTGHNVLRFDSNMYKSWAGRLNLKPVDKLWIDTMIDIKGHEGKKLSYLAADHGILNLFPHSAMADCQTVLAIIEKYDINELVARAKTPTVVIRGRQDRTQNDLVKKAKFRWNPDRKIWWRPTKECDVQELMNSLSFPISVEKELTVEELDGR